MKKILYLPLIALGFTTACVEDEGNYLYTPTNVVTIDDPDADNTIQVLSYVDAITLTPDITGSIKGDNLEDYDYTWVLCYNDHTHQLIGTEKELNWNVDVPPGSYAIYFTVKDRTTGLESSYSRNFFASSPFTKGFLVLGNIDGNGRVALDMLTMPPQRDTVMVEDAFDASALNLQNAENLFFTGQTTTAALQTLWLNADGQSYKLSSGKEFDVLGLFNSLEIIETNVPHKSPMVVRDMFPRQNIRATRTSNGGYVTDDMIVFGSLYQGDYYVQPANRYSATSTEYFKPYPMVFCNATTFRPTIFVGYDMDENCFVKLPSNAYGTMMCTRFTDSSTNPWKFNAGTEGRSLVYGENSYDGFCHCLMTDQSGKFFISNFKIPDYTFQAYTQDPLYTVDPDVATDFDKATSYMFSGTRKAILYTVGKRLYQYDYSYNKIDHIDFDDEITYLEAEFCSTGSPSQFFVATYGDAAKGIIYKMSIGKDPNTLTFEFLEGQKWETRLKVKDMEWKNAN